MDALLTILVVGSLFAFGAWTQHLATDYMLDADQRERDGRPQLGGLSAKRWNFWLTVSPWHLVRYALLLRKDKRRERT